MRILLLIHLTMASLLFLSSCGEKGSKVLTDKEREELRIRLQSANMHLQNNDFDRAIEELNTCLKINPEDFEAHFGLGFVYFNQRKLDLAVEVLREAIEIDSMRTEPHILLARIFMGVGRWEETSQEFDIILELKPEDMETRFQLVDFITKKKMDAETALEEVKKILEINPDEMKVHLLLGQTYLSAGHFSQAIEKFQFCMENLPGEFEPVYHLGITYLRNGEYRKAVNFLKRALDIDPENLHALWNLRIAHSLAGRKMEELEDKYRLVSTRKTHPSPVIFKDVAQEAGVAKVDGGRGSAWGDYDNDGDLDLLTVGSYTPHSLYRNNGDGTFTDVTISVGIQGENGFGSLFADYDNDGDLDIYVTQNGWFGKGQNTLWRNERNHGKDIFVNVTQEAGVGDTGSSFTAAWGDLDNDGYLDLYVANGVIGDTSPNRLYHNNGDGTFTDFAPKAGVDNRGRTIGCALGDYDEDGHLDIHIVNLGETNILYRNNGDGTFSNVTQKAGALTETIAGYVTWFFDYDNDDHLDIFICSMGSFPYFILSWKGEDVPSPIWPILLHNNGDGTFTNTTKNAGLDRSFGSMGANYGDVDNNGYLDIYLGNAGPPMDRLEPNALFLNNGDGTFTDVTDAAGVGNIGKGHGNTFADYDNDGDLDLYAPVGGAFVGDQWPNSLYRNEGTENNSLIVRAIGTRSNRDGIGAKIYVTSGDFSLFRVVEGGCGFGSTNSLPIEFGLGKRKKVDLLEIRWPSGLVETYENIEANQLLIVTEGKGVERKKYIKSQT
jgi:tetratricopeptide (TPR) repeat protein